MSDHSRNLLSQASHSSEGSPIPSGQQITPGRLRTTPRSAVSALGLDKPIRRRRRRPPRQLFSSHEEERRVEENIELGFHELPKKRPPPPTDPKEHLYKEIYISDLRFTNDFEEDLEVLKDYGFIIDSSRKGFLGEGFYGEVYKGVYGQNVTQLFVDFLKSNYFFFNLRLRT